MVPEIRGQDKCTADPGTAGTYLSWVHYRLLSYRPVPHVRAVCKLIVAINLMMDMYSIQKLIMLVMVHHIYVWCRCFMVRGCPWAHEYRIIPQRVLCICNYILWM